jgi:hypothetical protein
VRAPEATTLFAHARLFFPGFLPFDVVYCSEADLLYVQVTFYLMN